MVKRSLLFTGFIALFAMLPSHSFAQQNVQSSDSLQSQSPSAQNTGNLQTQSSPTQNSSASLLESQPSSLGVVGNPNQQKPSVVVGRSESRAVTTDLPGKKSSAWSILLIIAVLGLVFWVVYKMIGKITPPELISDNVEQKPVKIAEKSSATQRKKLTTSKKKKKKRTHR